MSELQISLKYNKYDTFFSRMKVYNRDKYMLIKSFDKDLDKSIVKYIEFVNNTMEKVQDIFLTEDREYLGELLKNIGYMSDYHISQRLTHFERSLFCSRESALDIQYRLLERYIKIVDYYEGEKKC